MSSKKTNRDPSGTISTLRSEETLDRGDGVVPAHGGRTPDHDVDEDPALASLGEMFRNLDELEPPEEFTSHVMTRVRGVRRSLPVRLWIALTRPRTIRVNLAQAFAGACIAMVLMLVAGPALQRVPFGGVPASKPAKEYLVQFTYRDPGAAAVYIAGTFNQWKPEEIPLADVSGNGVWTATVPLKPDVYEYMFYVDGHWKSDDRAAYYKDDGFGRKNAVLRLGNSHEALS